ncbi:MULTISPECIES: hypothetical protein [Streptomyces]|uniref:Uncharacterized protein n=1 Tax=Streptomyces dengpaensis TaxID=2049881 RepID=A0ABN5I5P3_9ACTN|nr:MULTISPECIES: hypothetical protein [Streptomyces]AVH58396.1 hypothetical protein C4B68_24450 [Streptomyces dengpaensis]PIB06071.1 hypothetical protein B1C81_26170 [Streptomyces sp. HG99]
MKTYAVRGARTKLTGHYRRPGTRDLYCGRPAGAINDYAREVHGFKLCARCVKNEALDRAAATATAEAWLDQAPTEVQQAVTEAAEERAARASVRHYIAREFPLVADLLDIDRKAAEDEARLAAQMVTEAEATAGTWRGEWIGARAASTTPTLFDVDPDTEQGALFA